MSEKRRTERRALVLAPFFVLEGPSRPRAVAAALAELMPVDILTSDFDHFRKTLREPLQSAPFSRIVYLKTRAYSNNVCPARLISHILFSLRAAAYAFRNRGRYDVVYATVPLNMLAWLAFIGAGAATKIVDAVDIWPDSLPFPVKLRRSFAPFFAAWKWLFKSSVHKADIVMAVSDSFLDEASLFARGTARMQRFYIGHERLAAPVPKQETYTLAYVGNLGHLYDFETLFDVLAEDELRKTIQFCAIGAGDRREWMQRELERREIHHQFHGVVLQQDRLAAILNSCHAGFNGYLHTTACFSYKAGTYFAAGLPLINSMRGDLEKLVERHGLGENYAGGNREQLRQALLRLLQRDPATLTANCHGFFKAHLEPNTIHQGMTRFFEDAIDGTAPALLAARRLSRA